MNEGKRGNPYLPEKSTEHHIELVPGESVRGECVFDAETRKVKTTFLKDDKKEQKLKYCYLSEYEAGMGRELVDAQILLGLKTCKTGGDVFGLLKDVRQHERDLIKKEKLQGLTPRDEDSSFCSYCNVEMPVYREFMTVKRVYHCPKCLRIDIKDFELGEQK